MKKTVITIVILTIVFICGMGFGAKVFADHIYSRHGEVVELDCEHDEVIWVDGVGYEWIIESIDDWMIGDNISVINFDMFTENIEDDYTIEYRYEVD